MNEFFIYLLKASAGIAIFCLPYFFFMRKEPNLLWKRVYLLIGLLASFVFPFFELSLTRIPFQANTGFFLDIPYPYQESLSDTATAISGKSYLFNTKFLLTVIYLTGMIFIFIRTIFSMISWNRIRKSSQPYGRNLFYSERNEVFSFFNFIHLPAIHKSSSERNSLLYHEQAHVRQLHYIDLLLAEAAVLLTWFNPFTWLIIRMIKENHEHLADREVLSRGVNPAHYRAHLLNQTLGIPVFSFGQAFNHSLTKKRFEMMKTKKSKRSGLMKLMVIVPLVLFSISLLSLSKSREGNVSGTLKFADTGEFAAGVSIVIKNSTTGTVSDIDGSFELPVPGKCQLVFSFVGYNTRLVDVIPGDKLEIQLEPKIYEIEMEHIPATVIKNNNWSLYSDEEIREATNEKNAQKHPENQDEGKEIFIIVEEMPQFPGGLDNLQKYIYANLEYPDKASKSGKEGSVLVKFNVNTQGQVESPEIIKSTDPVFNASALKVFSDMPQWMPGKQRGKSVKVSFTVPVYFKLSSVN